MDVTQYCGVILRWKESLLPIRQISEQSGRMNVCPADQANGREWPAAAYHASHLASGRVSQSGSAALPGVPTLQWSSGQHRSPRPTRRPDQASPTVDGLRSSLSPTTSSREFISSSTTRCDRILLRFGSDAGGRSDQMRSRFSVAPDIERGGMCAAVSSTATAIVAWISPAQSWHPARRNKLRRQDRCNALR